MLNLSNLKPASGSTKSRKKVGRGGKRGTYAGRGLKGQKSRSGGKGGLKALGFKQTLQRIPKVRGFKSSKPKMEIVKLADLKAKFQDGEVVDIRKMIKADLIESGKTGVKVLGNDQMDKKLIVVADKFSQAAEKAISQAGGQAQLRNQK